MFDIAFIPDAPIYTSEDGWSGQWGRVQLGDFIERFIAPLGRWDQSDYKRQWIDGAQRLIDGERRSAFMVEAGRLWWTAWRDGSKIYIQQQLLIDEDLSPACTARAANLPYDLIGTRESHSEDGEMLSEWLISLDDLREFMSRSKEIQ